MYVVAPTRLTIAPVIIAGAITKQEFAHMLKAKKTRSQMMLMESIGGDAFNGEETR